MSEAISTLSARVRLLKPVRMDDDLGGAAIAWSDQGGAWAAISARGASEDTGADALAVRAEYTMRIRARADVRAGWRLAWGARLFRILSVHDAEDARLALACEEIFS